MTTQQPLPVPFYPSCTSCTTEEFWEHLGHPNARRLNLHMCAHGKELFYCSRPPEHVPGFLQQKITEALNLLGFDAQGNKRSFWQRLFT